MKLISFRTLRSMCLDLIIFLIPLTLFFFTIPWIFKLLMPFILGLILYFAAKPLNRFFLKKKFFPALSAFLSLGVICALAFILLRIAGGRIFAELRTFTQNPPLFYTDTLNSAVQKFSTLASRVRFRGISLETVTPGLLQLLQEKLGELVGAASSFLINFAKGLPSLLIAIFAAIFTAYFLLKESSVIFPFFKSFFGEKFLEKALTFKDTLFSVVASYIRAQLIIEGIIFLVVLAGFFALGIKYAFLLAVLTTLVDAVPILGTGTMLIPMAAFNFLTSNPTLGWGLVILYGISLITRQLCEPRILGKSLGIHPLATVFSLYVGMKLFGIWGLILGPLVAIFVKFLIFPSKNSNKCLHF